MVHSNESRRCRGREEREETREKTMEKDKKRSRNSGSMNMDGERRIYEEVILTTEKFKTEDEEVMAVDPLEDNI